MKNFSNKSRVIIESFDHTVHDIDEDVKSFLFDAVRQRIINEQSEAEKALAALSDEPGATVQDGAFKGLGRGALKGVIAMEKSDDEEKKKKAEELSQETESQKLEKDLDYEVTQGKLAAAGMTPAVGIGADLAAAGHSLMHGKLGDVGVNLLAAIPLIGLGTRAASTAVKTSKIAGAVDDARKAGDAASAARKAKVDDAVKKLDAEEAATTATKPKADSTHATDAADGKRARATSSASNPKRIEALGVELPKPKVDDDVIPFEPVKPTKPGKGYEGPDPRLEPTTPRTAPPTTPPKTPPPPPPKTGSAPPPPKVKADAPPSPKGKKSKTGDTPEDKQGLGKRLVTGVKKTPGTLTKAALGYEAGRIGYNIAAGAAGRPDLQTKDDTLAHAAVHATHGRFGEAGKSIKQAYEANPVPSVIAGVIAAAPGLGKLVGSGLKAATGEEPGDVTELPGRVGRYIESESEKLRQGASKGLAKTYQRGSGRVTAP